MRTTHLTHRRRKPRKRKPEVILPAEAARRTRFVTSAPPTPREDELETLIRQRTSERLSGEILHEALQGKPYGFHLTVADLDAYTARAIIRALLPWVRRSLPEIATPNAERDRQIAWIERAEAFIL